MESSLSLYNTEKVTNEDIVVTYTPSKKVLNYEYIIYEHNREIKRITVGGNKISYITLNESGTYYIEIIENVGQEQKQILKSGEYQIDKEIPILEVGDDYLTLKQGSKIDVMGNVKAIDNYDGDITNQVKTNENQIHLDKIGNHKLIYTVNDSAGNEVSKTVMIHVIKDNTFQLLVTQGIMLLGLFSILIYFIKYNKGILIEKRISRYSVKPIKDYSHSFFGSIIRVADKIIYKISNFLSKSVIVKKSSKRYNKYVKVSLSKSSTVLPPLLLLAII